MANRADQLRYRFAFRLTDGSFGLGIERLEHGKVAAIYSLYGEGDDWLDALCGVLDAEPKPFTLVWAQRIRRGALDDLTRRYDCRKYDRYKKLRTCRAMASDAVKRKTTITEEMV